MLLPRSKSTPCLPLPRLAKVGLDPWCLLSWKPFPLCCNLFPPQVSALPPLPGNAFNLLKDLHMLGSAADPKLGHLLLVPTHLIMFYFLQDVHTPLLKVLCLWTHMVQNRSLAFLIAIATCHHLNRAWNKVGGDKNLSERTREDLSRWSLFGSLAGWKGRTLRCTWQEGANDFNLADRYTFTFRNRRSFGQGQSSIYLYLARLGN